MSAKDARGVAKPSRKMVAEAAAWITRLHGSSRSAEVEAGFREWLAADAGHAAAFEGMTEIWDTMPAVPAGQLPRVVVLPRSPVSRPWVRAAAAIALCAVIACAFVYLPRGLSYATETGEQRIVNLDDGSRVSLNSGTRMAIRFADHERRIVLEEGEAYFEVAQDSRRPFVVVAGTHRVTALGTSFVVRYEGDRTAVVLVDGAQSVSHMAVDVQQLDCELFVLSGHKIFAPTGIGVLYGKKQILAAMPPWQGGGNMIADVTFEKTVYQPPPWRFEAGTGSIADAVGLGAALEYVSSLGLPNIARHEHELRVYAEDCLRTINGLTIIGTAKEKAGVISFVLDGVRTEDVGGMLDQEGIAVRSGHHCAQPILRRFGLEATVRASLAPYNTREDIDALVAAVRRIQTGRPEKIAR